MRGYFAFVVAWGLSVPAIAQQKAEIDPPRPVMAVPAAVTAAPAPWRPVVPGQRDDLTIAIVTELETQMARAADPFEKAFLSQIAGHYREPGSEPMWVRDSGLTRQGSALVEELTNADQYGLDPNAFDVPALPLEFTSIKQRAVTEASLSRAAVLYAWHARGGRVNPYELSRWLDRQPRTIYASDVFRAIETAGDAVAGLRSFHPEHPQFELLRQAYLAERGDAPMPELPTIPAGDRINVGDRHPHVELIRARLGMTVGADADLLDRRLMGRIREYMSDQGYGRKRSIDDDVRGAINRATPKRNGSGKSLIDKYLVNLERWRTMPAELGDMYIFNNLPEFLTRVIHDERVIHEERIIIGKPETQTPIFSDEMSHVIFQPEWGVPESIKLSSILPHLRGGDFGVLQRRGMAIKDGNRIISPTRYRWAKTDIRHVPIIQGPGPSNPLGRLKFMFPNGHDVYMHDTPDKHLFDSNERTFSHGCIRVRSPDRFAEVLLGVEGWTADDVKRQLKVKTTHKVDLSAHIPVHNVYFTMWARADGSVAQFKDVYGHDNRFSEALAGKSIQSIALRDPAMAQKRRNDELRTSLASISPRSARVVKRRVAAAPAPFSPFFKQQLGKPLQFKPKKYYAPVAPPRLLYFQVY